MQPIKEMIVFIEPNCPACKRVIETVKTLHSQNFIARLVVLDRSIEPETCANYGVFIFPAVSIEGRLAFYGEISVEDIRQFVN